MPGRPQLFGSTLSIRHPCAKSGKKSTPNLHTHLKAKGYYHYDDKTESVMGNRAVKHVKNEFMV